MPVVVVGALASAVPCHAASDVAAGKAYAQANCARGHSIDKSTPSSLPIAPPFRTLHERYPVESLEEALGAGLVLDAADHRVRQIEGMKRISGQILQENAVMLKMCRELGFEIKTDPQDRGLRDVTLTF